MKLWGYMLIIVVSILFLFYFLYKRYKLQQNNKEIQREKEYQDYLENLQKKLIMKEIEEESSRVYKLNTHEVQYSLYYPIY